MPRRRPFSFGLPKLRPLQIFFGVLLLILVVIVIVQVIKKNKGKNNNGNNGSGNGNLGDDNGNLGDPPPTVGTYTIVNGVFDSDGYMWHGAGNCKIGINQKIWPIGQSVTTGFKFTPKKCSSQLIDGNKTLNWDLTNNRWVSTGDGDDWVGFRFQLNPGAQPTDPSPYDSIVIAHYYELGKGHKTEERNDRQTSTYTPPIPQYTLTINTTGTGPGSVITDPSPLSDTGKFLSGTVVKLTAIPDQTSTFTGWTGGVTSTGTLTGTITMNTDLTVTANFSPAQIQSSGFIGIIPDNQSGIDIAWFPALNSPQEDLRIIDPVFTGFYTSCFTQLKNNTIIFGGYNVNNGKTEIYKVSDINNLTNSTLISTLPSTVVALVLSITQINDESYVTVVGAPLDAPTDYGNTVYQSSLLEGPWTPLTNFPENIYSLIQKTDGTFYYTVSTGIPLYSSSTLSSTQWTETPSQIPIYTISQLNDGSFVGIGNSDDASKNNIYTSNDAIVWTLQNSRYYCLNISQINIY